MLIRKLVIFLIRKRLGLKIYEKFQFTNQRSEVDYYYFTRTALIKCECGETRLAGVGLNWLLSRHCQIKNIKPL